MKQRKCVACGQSFTPRPQTPNQCYCPASDCQRERRRQWQKTKRQTDPDYRDNQARAQRAWMDRNPAYWREYRDSHTQYTERNRLLQQERNQKKPQSEIAKMDSSIAGKTIPEGIYRIMPVDVNGIAKMDVWIAKIIFLS